MTSVLVVLVIFAASECFAIKDQFAFLDEGDAGSGLVQSIVREVRAAVPENLRDLLQAETKLAYTKHYDDGGKEGNEKGFYKRTEDRGSDGYKHFDSFHKKDADKYGHEGHSAFGKFAKHNYEGNDGSEKYNAGKEGDESYAIAAKGGKSNKGKGGEDADEEDAETKHTYQVVDFDGDYGEGGHAGSYTDGESYSEHYGDGGEGGHYTAGSDGGNYESGGSYENDGENSSYTEGAEGDGEGDGESEHYTAEEEEDSDY